MLLHRLDAEVGNLPHMADACDESGNLAERDSSLGTTVPDHDAVSEQEQLLLYLLYAPPAKHVYLASRLLLLPGSQTVCPPLRLCSLD
jgi:hypothetical protein